MLKCDSALATVPAVWKGAAVHLSELAGLSIWQLDAWQHSEQYVLELFRDVTGLSVAANSTSSASAEGVRVLWAGPARYWLVCSDGHGRAHRIRSALDANQGVINNISDSRCVISLRGSAAESLLQCGVAVDLHPGNFRVQQVLLTALGRHTPITLQRVAEDAFELYVYRSYAQDTLQWLLATAEPLGASWQPGAQP